MASETNVNYSVITLNMEMNLGVPEIGCVAHSQGVIKKQGQ